MSKLFFHRYHLFILFYCLKGLLYNSLSMELPKRLKESHKAWFSPIHIKFLDYFLDHTI